MVDVDRGGKITWHGPGQLVGYPIVRLPEPIDVVAHVRRLERLLIDVLAELGVDGYRSRAAAASGCAGRCPRTRSPRSASASQKGVTMHGFALNCDNTLAGFRGIIPCGITDAGVTTVSEVVGRDVGPADIIDRSSRSSGWYAAGRRESDADGVTA